jgi:hypothetical protein
MMAALGRLQRNPVLPDRRNPDTVAAGGGMKPIRQQTRMFLPIVVCAALTATPQALAQSRPKFQLRSAQPKASSSAPSTTLDQPEPPRTRTAAVTDQAELPPLDVPRSSAWAPPADAAASLDGGVSLNPALLEPIRDNTLGLEPDDRHAYFLALWLCREVGPERLAEFAEAFQIERRYRSSRGSSSPPSTFVDMLRHPQDYRGRPVTLQGRLRRMVKLEPGENDLGVRHVYEGWVYDEHAQHNPCVVLFTRKPSGLPLGGELDEEVRCTGYFLKLYGYDAHDTLRKAPLVIAGELEWNEQPLVVAAPPVAVTPWHYLATTLLALAVIGGLWRWSRAPASRRAWPTVIASADRGLDASFSQS